MQIQIKTFQQLTNTELFQIYKLRTQVFVVEQNCVYQEVDDADIISRHLQIKNTDGQLVGYLRLIPESDRKSIRIGRVVVNPNFRKQGFGRQLVASGIEAAGQGSPQITTVKIQAQAYLQEFYTSFGFQPVSDVYLDTGIPHIDMVLKLSK